MSSAAATRKSCCDSSDSRRRRSRKTLSTCCVRGSGFGQRLSPSELSLGQRRRQLEKRQRVPSRQLGETVAHQRGRITACSAGEQRRGGLRIQTAEHDRLDAGPVEAPHVSLARGEQHHDPLRVYAPRHEQQCIGRAGVEPMRVVDQTEHRALLGQLREEREAGGEDEESFVGRAILEAECASQRPRLRTRKLVQVHESRTQELVERREWKLGLGLDAACAQDVHVERALTRIYEEGCLADAGLASDDDCPALRGPCPVEQHTDCLALLVTPEEDGCLRRCGAHQSRGRRDAAAFEADRRTDCADPDEHRTAGSGTANLGRGRFGDSPVRRAQRQPYAGPQRSSGHRRLNRRFRRCESMSPLIRWHDIHPLCVGRRTARLLQRRVTEALDRQPQY